MTMASDIAGVRRHSTINRKQVAMVSTSLPDLKQNVAAADVVFSDLKGIANTDIRQFWVRTGPDYNR